MGTKQVVDRVWEIAEPLASQQELEVVDVEYRAEHGHMILRVLLDREGGVTLDELARISRELSDLLEVHEVIAKPHMLEVSSPGVNRPLRRREHFVRFTGKRIRVRSATAIDGRWNFLGTLVEATDADIALRLEDGVEVRIPFGAVTRANYEHDFGREPPRGLPRRGDAGRAAGSLGRR
jgi:ribosome maturation factor RimP